MAQLDPSSAELTNTRTEENLVTEYKNECDIHRMIRVLSGINHYTLVTTHVEGNLSMRGEGHVSMGAGVQGVQGVQVNITEWPEGKAAREDFPTNKENINGV
ncbi:hypothetical protein N7478_010061 [Penicillium angulare]|uniref:uncharacterized protein n=1 Tax=Penicillium angulare TaxID=116970 RepID=UPI00254184D8|nr:uncharacterized protein N7478_010061 [Penicillium angulare]KAJ5267253.1 hypothetical protein N7478_010061 [Penicillium angulare]